MIVKKLSLCVVRMAVKRPAYPHMWNAAMTSNYHPALNYDKTLIHGHYTVFSTLGGHPPGKTASYVLRPARGERAY